MIYCTLGTMFLDFPRLIHAMDAIAAHGQERVVIQLGLSKTIPEYCEYFDFKGHEEILAMQQKARVIVAHAGIGVTQDALRLGKPLVLVPRLKRFGEHMNDHQLEIAEAVAQRNWGAMVTDIANLEAICAHPPTPPKQYQPEKEALLGAVRTMVLRVSEENATRQKRP